MNNFYDQYLLAKGSIQTCQNYVKLCVLEKRDIFMRDSNILWLLLFCVESCIPSFTKTGLTWFSYVGNDPKVVNKMTKDIQ